MKKFITLVLSLSIVAVCAVFLCSPSVFAQDSNPFSVDVTSVDFGSIEHGDEDNLIKKVKITNLTGQSLDISVQCTGNFELSFVNATIAADGWATLDITPLQYHQEYSGSITVYADNFSVTVALTGTPKHRYPHCESADSENHNKFCWCGHQDGPYPHSFVCDGQNNSLASEATCTESAYAYRYCSECNFVDGTQTFAIGQELGHDVGPAASGYTADYHTKYCQQCENDIEFPHEFDQYIFNNDATCTQDGTETATCTGCIYSYTRTAQNTATGHGAVNGWSYSNDGRQKVCNDCGYTEYLQTFSVDTDLVAFGEIEHGDEEYLVKKIRITNLTGQPLAVFLESGNNYMLSFVNATIAADGWATLEITPVAYQQDYNCIIIISAEGYVVPVAVTGTPKHRYPHCESADSENHNKFCWCGHQDGPYPHSFVCDGQNDTLASEATCTKPAYAYRYCSECGSVDGTQTFAVGQELGHDVGPAASGYTADYHIKYCQQCESEIEFPHEFGDYISNDDATCTQDETENAFCTGCDYINTRTVQNTATGHSFSDYVVFDVASCMENAKEIAYCDYGCGTTDVREIPDTIVDHHYILYPDGTVKATCTTDGQTMWMCNWCRDSYMRVEQGSATGHSFEEYVYNKDATCTADGTLTAVCSVCGETVTTVAGGSAKGHDYDAGGYCTRCGHHSGIHTPDTGDTHSTALWLVVCTLSALALAATAVCKKLFEN